MLRKPVEFVELADNPDSQLPVEIQQLYRDIYDLAVDRERFIPKGLKKAVQGLVPGVKARYFSEQDEPYDSSTASRELETLLEIKADSQLCRSSNASEAAWNSDVHSPLLKTALKPFKHPLLRRHVLTSSRISHACIPPMQEGSCYDVAGSKMVDYGIALHPEDGDPLDLCDRGNKIDIIGHISIGDTMSLDGLFIIVAVIRRLATWIQDDFRTWLENVLI
ncbi:hypothetical protein EDB80DRAFT_887337 [Ilyonectria destructans]|nr:hypothetical protein EDB80DRAFT_887337 [Ilyonectria destructans]